jgi:hypothetical protein
VCSSDLAKGLINIKLTSKGQKLAFFVIFSANSTTKLVEKKRKKLNLMRIRIKIAISYRT